MRRQTRPAMASQRNGQSGFANTRTSETRTSVTPSQLMISVNRFNIALPPPPLAVHRLRRDEQAEGDETEVVDHVLAVDDAAHEVLQVARERQVAHDLLDRRSRQAAHPVQ